MRPANSQTSFKLLFFTINDSFEIIIHDNYALAQLTKENFINFVDRAFHLVHLYDTYYIPKLLSWSHLVPISF